MQSVHISRLKPFTVPHRKSVTIQIMQLRSIIQHPLVTVVRVCDHIVYC
jgi:hypothetical protein